jgi:hypothetical protein
MTREAPCGETLLTLQSPVAENELRTLMAEHEPVAEHELRTLMDKLEPRGETHDPL